jgi:hypothetical protein
VWDRDFVTDGGTSEQDYFLSYSRSPAEQAWMEQLAKELALVIPGAVAEPERGIPLETRLDLDTAADRARRQLELAADPDQGDRVGNGSLQEAHVILALMEAGQLPGPVSRMAGHGDCTDATGQDWDVKRPRDGNVRPPFDVGSFVEGKIRYEVQYCRENVIIDLTGLGNPAHRQALREAVDRAGLAAHVR